MTREEILAMEAGRKLNALVAEKVMGYRTIDAEYSVFGMGKGFPEQWEPSTDISAAWEVVEKFKDYGVVYTQTRGHYCFIQTTKERYQSPSCDTAPEAICKAALLAVMDA